MSPSDRLRDYLDTIDAAAVHQERAQRLLALYLRFPGVEPTGFFVSEYPEDDGTRVYESLWLFSENLAMEAQFPAPGEEHFDFVPLSNAVRHVIVEAKEYNLAEASIASRMRVEAWFSENRMGELRASGRNCEALRAVLNDYLLPNLATPSSD